MRPDIVRQPLLLAVFSLLVIIAVAFIWGELQTAGIGTQIATPLGSLLRRFQDSYPVCSQLIASTLLLLSGITTGRLTVRYGLYPVNTSLAIPLYGIVACGILLGENYLTEILSAFILLLSTRNYMSGYRTGYAIGPAFRGSFFLGILPLLYAPALPLPILFLPAAFCFRRTLREAFIALCGAILPLLITAYISWGVGNGFADTFVWMWKAFLSDSGYRIFENTPLLTPAILGIVLFITLCGIFFSLACFRTQSLRAKGILTYLMILFTATTLLATAPSATPGLLAIIALPAAILMPQTFIRTQTTIGSLLYLMVYGLCIINIILY